MKNIDHILNQPWRVIEPCREPFRAEDISIFTDDGVEVVGCSEWMRAEAEVFEYIVKLHNESLKHPAPPP